MGAFGGFGQQAAEINVINAASIFFCRGVKDFCYKYSSIV